MGHPVGVVGPDAEVVAAVFRAFARRDLAALQQLADPALELHARTGRLAHRAGPYVGHAGLQHYLDDVALLWAELRPEPDHWEELGDGLVLATGRVYGWGVGRVIDAPAGWLWRVRDGRVVEGRVFETARAAREAAGVG
jgi:ketosteroid isomerase-like protein